MIVVYVHLERERERETERDRERQRETETDRDRQRQTETDTERDTHTHTHTDRQTDRQRQTDRENKTLLYIKSDTTKFEIILTGFSLPLPLLFAEFCPFLGLPCPFLGLPCPSTSVCFDPPHPIVGLQSKTQLGYKGKLRSTRIKYTGKFP